MQAMPTIPCVPSLSPAPARRGRSADVREGVTSFLEKRPAVFTDRVSADMPDFFPWWDEPPFE